MAKSIFKRKWHRLKAATMLSFTVFLCLNAKAQPTLTGSNFNPVPGDIYRTYYKPSSGTTISNGTAGANVFWDMSGVSLTSYSSDDSITYYSCSTAPVQACDSFPGANLAGAKIGGSISSAEYFYIADNDSLAALGKYDGLYQKYEPASIITRYPFTMGSSFTQSYQGISGLYYVTYSDTSTGDGYGTLKLANGNIYTNVLRVHKHSIQVDSNMYFSDIDTAIKDIYSWYMPGFHGCLFSIQYMYYNTNYYTSPVYSTTSTYTTSSSYTTGVNDAVLTDYSIKVSPNPSSGQFVINVQSAGSEHITGTICNMLGEGVGSFTGQTNREIPVNLIAPAGMYFISVSTEASKQTERIIIHQ